jgi:hypothetical protein
MEEGYFYFIHKNSITAGSKYLDKLPKISKVKRSKWPLNAYLSDRNEGEGPFESLQALKRKSFILTEINLQKHRQRILKSRNIIVTEGFINTTEDESFSIDYMSAFAHITIGKISNSKVKGVHFYNPNTVRLLEKKYIDSRTNCYSARIEKLNEHTEQWIEKETESTFFPDDWDLNKLFHDFNKACSKKQIISGNVYHSMTSNNINVEFIINQDEKILTCYPIIEKE